MLYCKSRTGKWSPHRVDPRSQDPKKTKTGIPLYTLEEAIQLGYQPPEKPAPRPTLTGVNMVVTIHDHVAREGEGFRFGTLTLQDGTQEPLTYIPHTPTALNTYRGRGATTYTVTRFEMVQGKWTHCEYRDGMRYEQAPVSNATGKFYSRQELQAKVRQARSDLADQWLGGIQESLKALCPETKVIQSRGKERTLRVAPVGQDWLQAWFDRRIDQSEKPQELYSFYQEWKRKRFEGDQGAFQELEGWAVRDSHLVKIEEAHRVKWVNQRNDTYKKLAMRLVRMAKGGSIQVSVPPLKQKGRKAKKSKELPDAAVSAGRLIESSVAAKTWVAFLTSCAAREGCKLEVTPRAPK